MLTAPTANAAGDITSFDELQTALNGCGTVTLTHDISAPTSYLTLPGCSATLDLNGHDLAVLTAQHYAPGTFTIDDSSAGAPGHFTADASARTPNPEDPSYFGHYVPAIGTETGDIVINGGVISAIGGTTYYMSDGIEWVEVSSPGIGVMWASEGSLTVNGGTVEATGGASAAGIGQGRAFFGVGLGAHLTVNGGVVRATGGPTAANIEAAGPGIGSGPGAGVHPNSSSGTTIVNGGKVIATGGAALRPPAEVGYSYRGGVGIGGGFRRPAGTLIVNGGDVVARGGDSLEEPGGMGLGAGPGGDYSADQAGAQGDTVIKAGATLTVSGGDTITPDARTPYTGRSMGLASSGDAVGALTVEGTLRLVGGDAIFYDYIRTPPWAATDAMNRVTSTGKILGSVDDPTVGSTIYGYALIRNDGVIALSSVDLGVTGQNHAVTFDARGGSASDAVRVFARSFEDGYRTLPTSTRTGYTFLGWNTAADGSGDAVTSTSELPDGDLTAYAQWIGTEIDVAKPAISGDAVVDGTLTVTPGAVTPTGTTSTYVWKSGETDLGTGATYKVLATDVGNTITVTQTAAKTDHPTGSATSDPTAEVTKAAFVSTGEVSVTGTPKVGQELTASSTVSTTPASTSTSGQWFRGPDKITGATDPTHTLTNADASAKITYVETRERSGYTDLVTSSDPTAKVTGGVITVGTPTISGDPVVDQTLTVTPGTVTPPDAASSYSWRSGSIELGTGTTYKVLPTDVGNSITVVHTVAKDDHDEASAESDPTDEVTKAEFASIGDVTIDGTPKLGSELTATSTVTATPASTSTSGQWFRGSTPIAGATSTTYTLVGDDVSSTIKYVETQQRTGYDDLVVSSDPTAKITGGPVTVPKPTISGDPIVDQILTAAPGGAVTPPGSTSIYTWKSGETTLGSGTTYKILPADVGNTITVVQTAAKADYDEASATSDATDGVTKATFAATGDVTVTGTPKVGSELTATSTVTATPASTSTSGQWFRGADPIADATGATYVLTNADASALITYVETQRRSGYYDVVSSSEPTAKVTGGVITVGTPAISGDAVVDQTLTVTSGTVTPSDASISFSWRSGDTELGTGPTYKVSPTDVGNTITVEQTATMDDHDEASAESDPTSTVVKATFTAGPTASFTGVLQVGEELTAVEGSASPTPDEYVYQWFAGDGSINGATDKTYTLKAAQSGKTISVRVTAIREGYHDADDTSPASAAVATDQAPTLSLATGTPALRLGQSTLVRWDSDNAATITASGDWSGNKGLTGEESVTPSSIGTSTYVLTAENDGGTTSAQVAVEVSLPAAALQVSAPSKSIVGKTISVSAGGLAPGEAFTIAIAGHDVATGRADGTGKASATVRVPSAVTGGRHTVRITGSLADRRGEAITKVTKKNVLKLRLARASVRAKGKQTLTITRLEPGEKVVVTYRGKRISSAKARASSKGVYTTTFRVGSKRGLKTIRVTSEHNSGNRSKSFRVAR